MKTAGARSLGKKEHENTAGAGTQGESTQILKSVLKKWHPDKPGGELKEKGSNEADSSLREKERSLRSLVDPERRFGRVATKGRSSKCKSFSKM